MGGAWLSMTPLPQWGPLVQGLGHQGRNPWQRNGGFLPASECKAEFLHLHTIETFSRIILGLEETALGIVGCVAATLASAHY